MPNDMAPQPPVTPPVAGETQAGQPPQNPEDRLMADAANTARNIVDAALATPSGVAAVAAANIAAAGEAVGVPNTMPTAETAVTDVSTSQSQANSGAIRVISAETPQSAGSTTTETAPVASAWPAPEANDASPTVDLPSPQAPKVNNEGLDAALNELYGDPATKTVEGAAVIPPKPAAGPTPAEVFGDQMAQRAAGRTWPEIQTPAAGAAVNPMERMSAVNAAAVTEVTTPDTTTTTPPETGVPTTTAPEAGPVETVPTTTGPAPEVGVPTTTPPQEHDADVPAAPTTTPTTTPVVSTVPTTISPSIPTVPPAGF